MFNIQNIDDRVNTLTVCLNVFDIIKKKVLVSEDTQNFWYRIEKNYIGASPVFDEHILRFRP